MGVKDVYLGLSEDGAQPPPRLQNALERELAPRLARKGMDDQTFVHGSRQGSVAGEDKVHPMTTIEEKGQPSLGVDTVRVGQEGQ